MQKQGYDMAHLHMLEVITIHLRTIVLHYVVFTPRDLSSLSLGFLPHLERDTIVWKIVRKVVRHEEFWVGVSTLQLRNFASVN